MLDFRERCVVRPDSKGSQDGSENSDQDVVINDGKLLLTLEKAIKLETLQTIARGPNYDLRHAAVKIICQRAITGRPFEEILSNATSKNPKIRWQALKSLRGIYQLISFTHVPQEMQPRVFKAVIDSLYISMNQGTVNPLYNSEMEAFRFLQRVIVGWSRNTGLAVEAGLVQFLADYSKKHGGIIEKYILNRFGTEIHPVIGDVVDAVYTNPKGRAQLVEHKLMAPRPEPTAEVVVLEAVGNIVEDIVENGNGSSLLESMRIATEFAQGLLDATRNGREARYSDLASILQNQHNGENVQDENRNTEDGVNSQ